ncbi:WYL domain-containing protein [Micromonospora sp. 15K316]|uniref:WYL domain-containing protein n=1 Tax=Micromonospora sp. 15K316 TaxID=2530376 RepID=UPI001FB7F5F4|nr:WYL domain-containing protein [Micromonospora sp. 15K316]
MTRDRPPGVGGLGGKAGEQPVEVRPRQHRPDLLQQRFHLGTSGWYADGDVSPWWRAHVREFRARLHRDEATVRLSPAGRERPGETADDVVVAAVDASAGPPDENGWTIAVLPIESLTHAHGDLLRLGAEVEVLAPAELRDRLAATASGLARIYGAT